MSKRGKKKKGKGQLAAPKVPVPEPLPLPPNFPGGLKVELLGLFLILAAFAGLGFNASRQESVTVDEFAHLPAGLSFLEKRDFRLCPGTPSLLRMYAALPLLWSRARLPLGAGWKYSDHWLMGYEFMYANAEIYQSLFARARVMIVFLGVLLIGLNWWWARSLYGSASGLAAAILTAFCPNIIAHSGLVTADLGTSLFSLASIFFFYRFCEKPAMIRALSAGLMLGLALLCKFTMLLLLPLLILLGIIYWLLERDSFKPKALGSGMALIFFAAWLTVNTGYLWRGFGTALGDFPFQSQLMKKVAQSLPPNLPVIFPYDYVRGFDVQSASNESRPWVYLFGKISQEGWRYYYLVAMAVKMTPGSLILILAGIASLAGRRKFRGEEIFIIGPAIFFIGIVSLSPKINNFGIRYVLPAFPFLYLLASRPLSGRVILKNWQKALVGAALAAHLVSSLLSYPDYLSYFNVAAGGPKNGYRILVDSNLDWGQDLIRLKKYMDEHKIDKICLAYFGRADPAIYGINYQLPFKDSRCGLLAISVSLLEGEQYYLLDGHTLFLTSPGQFRPLRHENPIGSVGYSILIFDLTNNPAFKNGSVGLEPLLPNR